MVCYFYTSVDFYAEGMFDTKFLADLTSTIRSMTRSSYGLVLYISSIPVISLRILLKLFYLKKSIKIATTTNTLQVY